MKRLLTFCSTIAIPLAGTCSALQLTHCIQTVCVECGEKVFIHGYRGHASVSSLQAVDALEISAPRQVRNRFWKYHVIVDSGVHSVPCQRGVMRSLPRWSRRATGCCRLPDADDLVYRALAIDRHDSLSEAFISWSLHTSPCHAVAKPCDRRGGCTFLHEVDEDSVWRRMPRHDTAATRPAACPGGRSAHGGGWA
jgi:hypothetical protein